ncbi:MFS transporter [Bradyrhizobium sp. G127]|jgi:predicted MFS family arabinose efflux permease|uniref:MFS transporter n=1 Tax=Bradyrhizobium sp. G127 TaxID=2904800 RepID=UPI001F2EDA6E|nr:MFS transporter [Bradyrhizobium sp. G127]MCF2522150.1 MFS transporter [Bradyrhizobium sp. G127]
MSSTPHEAAPVPAPGPWLVFALAIACGATVANIYYAQPLIGPISQSLGLDISAAGLIVTTLQIGYVAGLFFLVPLGDLVENKRLILILLGGLIFSLIAATLSTRPAIFIACSLLLGLTASATQVIVPMAGHLAPERIRGKTVGSVVSGLLFGILLARPVSTLIGGEFGWRVMYNISAAIMCATLVMLVFVLPRRNPSPGVSYARLIGSLWHLLLTEPVLQRRAAYQAFLFGAFTLFWTSLPLLLQAPPFALGHLALSAVMLSGIAGAFVAPYIGHLADRGHSRRITGIAIGLVALAFVLTWLGGAHSVAIFVIAGIALDAGVQANLVIGQRAIFNLHPDIRSRLNALYLAVSFLGGALGSALSGYAVAHGGVATFSVIGLAFALVTAALFATEFRARRNP